MLTDIQVFQSLETALPAEIRPSIARRIRRVDALWSALHEEGFLKKAVSFAGVDPERWRPGLLGLLQASETDYLRNRFSKGPASTYKISEDILARAEIALQEMDAQSGAALDHAAMAALALSRNNGFASKESTRVEISPLVWICLYSVFPDSRKVVEHLTESLPGSARTILEVLLANESNERTSEILERCIPAAGLASAAELCACAAAMGEQELAVRLGSVVRTITDTAFVQSNNPEKRILRARMLRLAGEPNAALPEADAARRDAKRMLLETLIESAQSAEAEKNFTTALSFWQEAGALSPATPGIRTGIARSLFGLGRSEEALSALPASSDDPQDLLLIARIRSKTGSKEKAIDAARQAYAKASTGSDPLGHMELADVLAECGDLRSAAQILTAVCRSWPNHPEGFARLAELYSQIGDWHACGIAAASAWHLHPEDNRPLRFLAQSAEHENRPKEAAEYYRLLAGRTTDDPAILLALAQTSLAAGDNAQAHNAAERTLALQPDCGEAHAILGLVDLAQGKEEQAFSALQKATRLAPTAAAPWKALAELHTAKGNREAAATTLRAGIESASDPADLLLALGRMLIGEGRLREAVSALERALALRPSDTDILIALAETSLGMQMNAEAEEYLNRALAIAPALFSAATKLASLLESLDRIEEARTVLERAIAADPESPQLLIAFGSLLLDIYRKDPDANLSIADTALSVLRQAQGMLGETADTRLQTLIGWAQVFTGQLPEAISLFSSLLQTLEGLTVEQKVDAHKGLAEAMLRSGDFPTAVHNLQAALQLAPADSATQDRLGEAYAASGLHEDAQEVFRKIIADKPGEVRALSGLASSLLALRRPDEAITTLRQASELQPSNPDLPIRLAEIFLQSGDGNQSRTELARALDLAGPHDIGIALRAGRLLATLKEFAEAASVLEKAAEENPASAPLLTDLGNALLQSGKHVQAFEVFRRASDLEPTSSVHMASASKALWADGRKSAALAFLKKAAQMDPQNILFLRRLAAGLSSVGLVQEALPHYARAIELMPTDAELVLEAAQAAFRAGDLEKADQWKESVALASSASADGSILQARIALGKCDFDKAVVACQQMVTSHPEDARGWALLAQSLVLQFNRNLRSGSDGEETHAAADAALSKAVELCSESPEALRMTGEVALLMEEYPIAIRCLESLCGSVPEDPEAHGLLAKAIILHEEYGYRIRLAGAGSAQAAPSAADPARSALARAAALGCSEEMLTGLYERAALAFTPPDPAVIESLENLNQVNPSAGIAAAISQAWLRFGDAERARKSAEAALNLEPEKETGRILMGICEWKAGRCDAALENLQTVSRIAPREALSHALSAMILFEMDQRDAAIQEMREAARVSPDNAAWQHTLGMWNDAAGDRAAALPCLQRAAELEPLNGEYHRRFARVLLRDGDPQTALVHFRKAVSFLADLNGDLYAEIGKAAIESDQPSEAYEAFRMALEKTEGQIPSGWQLGKARAALALGRREEARTIAKTVLNGEGHPPEARLILAEVEEAEGRLPEAIRHLDHAATEMSDPVLPALRLARLWTATGAAVRSSAAMQALLEAHPENDEAHHQLAQALVECGRIEDALRAGQKAAELAPRKTGHWILLGKISRKMGQLDQSLAALTRARELAPQDFRIAVECGLTYEAEQRWDLALDCYRTAMKSSPENAEIHYRMGVVHKNLRAYSDAAIELRKAVQIEPQNLAAHKLLSGVMALSLVYGIAPQPADVR